MLNSRATPSTTQSNLTRISSALASRLFALVCLVSLPWMTTALLARQWTVEQVIDQLGERYQLDRTEDGWALRPLEKPGTFTVIEVKKYLVIADGKRATERDLRPLIGREDAEWLFFLASGGGPYVDSVEPPPVADVRNASGSHSAESGDEAVQKARQLLWESLESALSSEEDRATLGRLKAVESPQELRHEIEQGVCGLGSRSESPRKETHVTRDRDSRVIACCSEWVVGVHEQEIHALVIGADLDVAGTILGNAVVVLGDAVITGVVEGDLVVVGGSIALHPGAAIHGDIFAVSSRTDFRPGSTRRGEVFRVDLHEVMAGKDPS